MAISASQPCYFRLVPGTAFGVLAGDLAYTWLAVRLARRTGRSDVTAMPFGLDTPSTIGMAATASMGILKLLLAFAGRTVRQLIPMAGLLGSLAGIALTIELSDPKYISPQKFAALMTTPGHGLSALSVIVALRNGFIITATIWAAFVVEMIERRLRSAAVYLAVGGAPCFFGIMHSVRWDGSAYVLLQLHGVERNAAIQFCAAYFLLAGVLLLLSLQRHRHAAPQ